MENWGEKVRILKLTVRNRSLHVNSEDSGAGVVTVGTTQDLMAREQCSQLETFISAFMSLLLCAFAIRMTSDR